MTPPRVPALQILAPVALASAVGVAVSVVLATAVLLLAACGAA